MRHCPVIITFVFVLAALADLPLGDITTLSGEILVVVLKLAVGSITTSMWFFALSLPMPLFTTESTDVGGAWDCLRIDSGALILIACIPPFVTFDFHSLGHNSTGTTQRWEVMLVGMFKQA